MHHLRGLSIAKRPAHNDLGHVVDQGDQVAFMLAADIAQLSEVRIEHGKWFDGRLVADQIRVAPCARDWLLDPARARMTGSAQQRQVPQTMQPLDEACGRCYGPRLLGARRSRVDSHTQDGRERLPPEADADAGTSLDSPAGGVGNSARSLGATPG